MEWPPGLGIQVSGYRGKRGRHRLEVKCSIAPLRFKIGCGLGSQCDFRHDMSVPQFLLVQSGADDIYAPHWLVEPKEAELRPYRTREVWSLLYLSVDQHRPCPANLFWAELIVVFKLQAVLRTRV